MRPLVFFFFIILFLPAATLRADDGCASVLAASGYTEDEKKSIGLIFAIAGEYNIPEKLLLPRLEEGVAKRVPFDKLSRVLENERTLLIKARELLLAADPKINLETSHPAWLRTVILLANKVPETVISAIAKASIRRRQDYRAASELYLSLMTWGLEENATLNLVLTALDSRIAGDDFNGIVTLFSQGRSLYIPPQVIMQRIKTALPLVDSFESLEKRVLY